MYLSGQGLGYFFKVVLPGTFEQEDFGLKMELWQSAD